MDCVSLIFITIGLPLLGVITFIVLLVRARDSRANLLETETEHLQLPVLFARRR